MLFAEYYNELFRHDLSRVVQGSPCAHPHESNEATIQPRMLSEANPVVREWPQDRRLLFAAGLFLTILADQVCYTHFPGSYSRFSALTLYPKWRGDCPGGCSSHIHPGVIFRTIGRKLGQLRQATPLPLELLPDDVISTMEAEVVSFVRQYLPEVEAQAFWARCDAEIPLDFRLFYRASRRPTP